MRVLISGGGIAGLTLAFWLQRDGHQPIVVEKSLALRHEGYMIDFFGSGYDVSDRMGILPDLETIHYPVARLAFVRADGRESFSLDYPTLRKLFDGRHFNFMRGDLERLLYSKIKGQVDVRFAMAVDSFDQDGAQVKVNFSDGSTGRFDLVVGADGVHSQVRRLAFGEEAEFSRFLGFHTAAYVMSDPPRSLLSEDAFSTLTVPGRQVAVYPIRGGKLATFFVYNAAWPIEDFSFEAAVRELRSVYEEMDWIIPELLDRCDPLSMYFDDVSQIKLPAWSVGRVALIGDACQCLSLLAGQGASMAMASAYVLSEELARAGGDVATALTRYEQRLKPTIEKKQRAGRKMARWFIPRNRVLLAIRNAVMYLSALPIGSWLVKRALAPESIFKG